MEDFLCPFLGYWVPRKEHRRVWEVWASNMDLGSGSCVSSALQSWWFSRSALKPGSFSLACFYSVLLFIPLPHPQVSRLAIFVSPDPPLQVSSNGWVGGLSPAFSTYFALNLYHVCHVRPGCLWRRQKVKPWLPDSEWQGGAPNHLRVGRAFYEEVTSFTESVAPLPGNGDRDPCSRVRASQERWTLYGEHKLEMVPGNTVLKARIWRFLGSWY